MRDSNTQCRIWEHEVTSQMKRQSYAQEAQCQCLVTMCAVTTPFHVATRAPQRRKKTSTEKDVRQIEHSERNQKGNNEESTPQRAKTPDITSHHLQLELPTTRNRKLRTHDWTDRSNHPQWTWIERAWSWRMRTTRTRANLEIGQDELATTAWSSHKRSADQNGDVGMCVLPVWTNWRENPVLGPPTRTDPQRYYGRKTKCHTRLRVWRQRAQASQLSERVGGKKTWKSNSVELSTERWTEQPGSHVYEVRAPRPWKAMLLNQLAKSGLSGARKRPSCWGLSSQWKSKRRGMKRPTLPILLLQKRS